MAELIPQSLTFGQIIVPMLGFGLLIQIPPLKLLQASGTGFKQTFRFFILVFPIESLKTLGSVLTRQFRVRYTIGFDFLILILEEVLGG